MKKRYQVSLTAEVADQIKDDLAVLNLPPATFSNMLDDMLTNFAPILHRMAEKKRNGEQVSFEEIAVMATQIMAKGMEE